jgi:hypothetical protein
MSRHPMLRGALAGLGLGLLWGVAARIYMRLLAENPSFSWVGTLFILGLAGLLGTGLGLVHCAQSEGRRRWWLLALFPGVLLFAGQGMPFIPAFAVGGLLFSRRHWALRALGAAGTASGVVLLWAILRLDEETMLSAPPELITRALVGMAVLSLGVAAGSSVLYRRWAPRRGRATAKESAGSVEATAGAAGQSAVAT